MEACDVNESEGVDIRSCMLRCILDQPIHRYTRFTESLSFLESSESDILGTVESFCEFIGKYGERIRDPDKRTVLNELRDILLGIRSLYYQRRDLYASFEVAWYEIEFFGHRLLGIVTSNVIAEMRRRRAERGASSSAIGNQVRIEELIRLEIRRYIGEHRRVLYLCSLIPAIDAAMNNGITASQREELDRIKCEATTELEGFYSDHRIPAVPLATVIRDISEEYLRLVRLSSLNSELGQDGVIPRRRDYRYYVALLPEVAKRKFLEVMSSIREYQKALTRAIDGPYRELYLFNTEVTKLATFVHMLKLKDHQVLVTDNLQTILVKGFVTESGDFIPIRSMDRKYIVLFEGFSICFDMESGSLSLGNDGMPVLYPGCGLYRISDTLELVPCSISNIVEIDYNAKPRRPKIC